MQVKIDVFENFFQKRRFNNEIYTRLTCLKDISVTSLPTIMLSLTTVLQGLPTSCQLELATCKISFPCPDVQDRIQPSRSRNPRPL